MYCYKNSDCFTEKTELFIGRPVPLVKEAESDENGGQYHEVYFSCPTGSCSHKTMCKSEANSQSVFGKCVFYVPTDDKCHKKTACLESVEAMKQWCEEWLIKYGGGGGMTMMEGQMKANETKKIEHTWKRERFISVSDEWDDSDIWSCPDCEWAVTLESIEDFDVDAPVEHGYNFCPHCGARRITE